VGGTVVEGVNGVFIDGIPVAVKGSKCICTGSPKANSITIGSSGVFVDGEQIAIVGSMTEHGGIVIEGVPGVTISGGFPVMADNPEKLESRIFNLQWRKEDSITRYGDYDEVVMLTADTVGYEDGEKVSIKVYAEGSECAIDEIEGTVQDGRVVIEWIMDRDKIAGNHDK
jgi:uncharacterized Zn-binding protein involved in type VI secretion